jgi:hypothetical protein
VELSEYEAPVKTHPEKERVDGNLIPELF